MADPAVLSGVVTGATAVLSGLIGYGTARGQRLVELKRIEKEHLRALAEHDDEARRERRELYLAYLALIPQFADLAVRKSVTDQDVDQWWSEFKKADTAVEILGSEAARQATYPMHECMLNAHESIDWRAEDFQQALRNAYDTHNARIQECRAGVVDAVRADMNAGRLDGDAPPSKQQGKAGRSALGR